jgi:hypothetical protein
MNGLTIVSLLHFLFDFLHIGPLNACSYFKLLKKAKVLQISTHYLFRAMERERQEQTTDLPVLCTFPSCGKKFTDMVCYMSTLSGYIVTFFIEQEGGIPASIISEVSGLPYCCKMCKKVG